jgi:hypothetical protein
VITSLDSDSDSVKTSPPQNTLALENGELVSSAVVAALKGSTSPIFGARFGPSALFDARRFGDLTPLERMTAGMGRTGVSSLSADEEMVDVASPERDEMAMDIEEL